ncbi:uncharacterized protein LOC102714685 isoform X2 [Oryza brachyantha]|uniref:uncharacterized protein LOC102714685 isoform X2 n=1 Tax=Oryza brachyantha TaxID=4533 RepID=UPI001ADD02CF|nr:uncharacterized protein LOC102714685 isoform X2 [Oryza brachyantha]
MNNTLNRLELKEEFEKDVRPYLASKLLLLHGPIEGTSLAYFDYLAHVTLKHAPVYVSSLDLTIRKRILYFDYLAHVTLKHAPVYVSSLDLTIRKRIFSAVVWEKLLKHVVDSNIFVCIDWYESYGNIQSLYHHGVSVPYEEDSFFRGESDASFNESYGIAKLAFGIMKDWKLLFIDIVENVKCTDINSAEAYAMLALLTKCHELNLRTGAVWTDNRIIFGVMSGEYTVSAGDPNQQLFSLLRFFMSKFDVIIPFWMPREGLFFPDGLIKALERKQHACPPPISISEVAKKSVFNSLRACSSYFIGVPLFRISNTREMSSNLADSCSKLRQNVNKNVEELDHSWAAKVFYHCVQSEEEKMQFIDEILEALDPKFVIMIMGSSDGKPVDVQKRVASLYDRCGYNTETVDGCYKCYLNVGGSPCGIEKNLVLVFDASLLEKYYMHHQADSCIIILPLPHELQTLKKRGVIEISGETFVCFHGATFDKTKMKFQKK